MSRETTEWLNENVLVGFTEKRGNAWHWKEGSDNHYPGAVPVEDVRKRLFDWEPEKVETAFRRTGEWINSGEFVYLNSKTGRKIAATTESHKAHGYSEWLITNVQNMLDDDVQIGSAGLLRNGAQAWVQVELTETQSAQGVLFRPTLLATTSLDGSIRSTYKAVNTIVVCDNTRAAALSEDTPTYGVKHTRLSKFKVLEAREAVGVQLARQAEAFEAEVDRQLHQEVNEEAFERFLDRVNPIPRPLTIEKPGRAFTLAQNKRERLLDMWHSDPRVSVWKNTAWGVLQLMNTYATHVASFKGDNRVETNMTKIVMGTAFDADSDALKALDLALAGV